jgi:hypothetical protein
MWGRDVIIASVEGIGVGRRNEYYYFSTTSKYGYVVKWVSDSETPLTRTTTELIFRELQFLG